jgi:ADP-heptose:LPS heptosyltransferase
MTNAKGRSLTLEDLEPLLALKNVRFVSLDYRDEVTDPRIKSFPFAAKSDDYDDRAALIAACDMVIGVNTTALHCAAAMGVKTWFLVSKYHQWRYARPSMLWYNHTRLIMQGDRTWGEVIGQVATEI